MKSNAYVRTGRSSFVEKRKLVRLGSGAVGAAQDENHTSKKVGVLRERVSYIHFLFFVFFR